jgi:hypothetical protein
LNIGHLSNAKITRMSNAYRGLLIYTEPGTYHLNELRAFRCLLSDNNPNLFRV